MLLHRFSLVQQDSDAQTPAELWFRLRECGLEWYLLSRWSLPLTSGAALPRSAGTWSFCSGNPHSIRESQEREPTGVRQVAKPKVALYWNASCGGCEEACGRPRRGHPEGRRRRRHRPVAGGDGLQAEGRRGAGGRGDRGRLPERRRSDVRAARVVGTPEEEVPGRDRVRLVRAPGRDSRARELLRQEDHHGERLRDAAGGGQPRQDAIPRLSTKMPEGELELPEIWDTRPRARPGHRRRLLPAGLHAAARPHHGARSRRSSQASCPRRGPCSLRTSRSATSATGTRRSPTRSRSRNSSVRTRRSWTRRSASWPRASSAWVRRREPDAASAASTRTCRAAGASVRPTRSGTGRQVPLGARRRSST